jgi:hypothetical protein
MIRHMVMLKINLDFDERGERCGLRLLTNDLTRGVGRATKQSTEKNDSSMKTSSFVDSMNLEDKVQKLL